MRPDEPPDFMRGIVLPLGISFITFQKIAYLVDIWRGYPKAGELRSVRVFCAVLSRN